MNNQKKILYLCLALSSTTVKAADSLEVRIKLKSVNDVLTFNQTYVPDNSQEYAWMVLIDSDNNPSTGNTGGGYGGNTGFDVALTISNFKLTGSTPQTGSIVSNYTEKKTVVLNGNQGTVTNNIRAFIDYTDSSLVMRGSKTFPELANVAADNRYFAITTYYQPSGITANDVSAIATIPSAITDPVNDVTSSFIDIKDVSINMGTVGVSESSTNTLALNIYPNPSLGIFKIECQNDYREMNLEIYNMVGERILQQQSINEVDLSNFPKGIYFVKIYDGKKIQTRKIIVQ